MRFDIVTIFPEFFGGPPNNGILGHGILERALRIGQAEAHTHDLRSFTYDRHRTVDDRPFGGGEGMVLKAQPIFECVESLGIAPKAERDTTRESVILLSAQGKRFTQATARHLAKLDRVVLICGRYEGVDERVSQLLCDDELSIGDYVLSGGELGAAVIVDAVVRLLPGVLGHADSSKYESFGEGDEPTDTMTEDGVPRSTHGSGGLLDYPHYTRPSEFRGTTIPEVLGNGDHSVIRKWRRQAALAKTLANRPDLLPSADLNDNDRAFLNKLGFNRKH
ncbi:tRNA (guanosine(37)-N1)-methyltransferase TrmD [Granulicella mallensis]|uniref:tRNA (guanine-N(1)-)-methyltransferase n=1 Tax=Granulicella mallensis (strain ATCC BAA-1857 / DSM 23137 / MP5ACTX8) TaxID=682795 RepID=G8NNY5_GRAMM|nr:tRNA (guanosine(37)-N1)-methyltransferase TrmD [Granulicella mallensis]AEU37089.1 tRNA (guanine-N1)-methyltransferase [Granulicella mallensis MP5ACTX8]